MLSFASTVKIVLTITLRSRVGWEFTVALAVAFQITREKENACRRSKQLAGMECYGCAQGVFLPPAGESDCVSWPAMPFEGERP
jgi:hypothetical protein